MKEVKLNKKEKELQKKVFARITDIKAKSYTVDFCEYEIKIPTSAHANSIIAIITAYEFVNSRQDLMEGETEQETLEFANGLRSELIELEDYLHDVHVKFLVNSSEKDFNNELMDRVGILIHYLDGDIANLEDAMK